MSIHKYEINNKEFTLKLPKKYRILGIEKTKYHEYLYILVDKSRGELTDKTFKVFVEDTEIHEVFDNLNYIGSFTMGFLEFTTRYHLFEIKKT